MQKPIEHTFTVERVISEGTSRRGDPFVEAKTSLGIVAFWGSSRNRANLQTIQSATPRFTVTCGCVHLARWPSAKRLTGSTTIESVCATAQR
jgi:hypothetical protein